jgi:NAD(P)-dependent dehydrogenase (short-subunit alcohol dehydrogenase family)
LDGRVALVTGAKRNIGLALARGLAEVGADILAVDRGGEPLDVAARDIREATGRRVVTVQADIGRASDIERVIDVGLREFERMDVLVLNAAERGLPADGRPRPPTEMADEQWDEVFRVNVLGNYRLIRGFAPRLAAGGVGSVITLLSGAGFIPVEGGICYGSSKAALWQMTKYLAHQEPRIRFNSVAPGRVSENDPSLPAERRMAALAAMKRIGRPREMVGACVYLASDAASYTTGEVIFCNGGRAWG